MNALKALGKFIDYCNRNAYSNHPEINDCNFQKGCQEILKSSDDRFANCNKISDILKEINFPDF